MYLYYTTKTFDEAEQNHWKCMESEWEQEKLKILNSLLGAEGKSVDFSTDVIVRLSNFMVFGDIVIKQRCAEF